jgi:formylmethanofuran dehydrogenase subunit E
MSDIVYISEIDDDGDLVWFCEKCGLVMPEEYFVMVDDDPYCPDCVPN